MSTLKYVSGEDVMAGDAVTYLGEAGRVEFVVTLEAPHYYWYLKTFGGEGLMLATPSFGSVYLEARDIDDHLELNARARELP